MPSNPFLRAFAAMTDEADENPKIEPSVQIIRLQEAFHRYRDSCPCPFDAGEIVTPRKDASLKHAGRPHIVLEVIKQTAPQFVGDPTSCSFGCRCDMRAAVIVADSIVAFWGESWEYEKWEGNVEA